MTSKAIKELVHEELQKEAWLGSATRVLTKLPRLFRSSKVVATKALRRTPGFKRPIQLNDAQRKAAKQAYRRTNLNESMKKNGVGFFRRQGRLLKSDFNRFKANPIKTVKQGIKDAYNQTNYFRTPSGKLKGRSFAGKTFQKGLLYGAPAAMTAKEVKDAPQGQKTKAAITSGLGTGLSYLSGGFIGSNVLDTVGRKAGSKLTGYKEPDFGEKMLKKVKTNTKNNLAN